MESSAQDCVLLEAVLVILYSYVCLVLACLEPRYSVVLRGDCPQLHPAKSVAIKVYEKPSLMPKKQKMATREAIVLKYLNSQG
jgi:hypothetical protein